MLTLIQRVHQVVWGAADVECEECGSIVHAQDAVWHGQHPYCCAQHEFLDSGEIALPQLSESVAL